MKASLERPSRVTVLDLDLLLPGAATCHVTATTTPSGTLPVVLVIDSSGNSGVSAHLQFDVVVAQVRALLPLDGEEPVWVVRWAERALASIVLGRGNATRDHVMQRSTHGWEWWPIPGRVTRVLMG